ncbi:MAG TPA: putative aminohydrolase SsnA [Dermatophilaceae bacterium]|nr:putative aminohydrolase SsnA [Dermatophilaceae bacterium]
MIIGNGPVITNDPAAPFVDNGAILVRDNVIEAIGTVSELRAAYPHEPFHDVAGRVIMPGLINAHTHAYSHYARGMAVSNPTRDFQEILENLWWRLDRMLTLEDVELNTTTTFVESIRNGVTTVFDHHSSPGAVEGSLFRQAEVARALGIRASLCYETSDRDGEEVFAQAVRENVDFMRASNTGEQDLVRGLFGVHASFTMSQPSLEACVEAQDGVRGGFHVHTAEGPGDEVDAEAKYGERIVERFHGLGMLGAESIAVHCVHATDEELDILKDTDTTMVHNPHSNMGNAVGGAPVVEALAKGIRCGLGTDAYTADMFASASVAKVLQSHRLGDPTVGFGQAMDLLFGNNPKITAKHFARPVGVLAPGAYADLITLDYDPITPLGAGSYAGHILFGMSGRMVNDTMVDGRWVMRDRVIQTIDEAAVNARSRAAAPRIWARM